MRHKIIIPGPVQPQSRWGIKYLNLDVNDYVVLFPLFYLDEIILNVFFVKMADFLKDYMGIISI